MLFTPSANWSLASSAAYRKVTWTTQIRLVTSLSDALLTGTEAAYFTAANFAAGYWCPIDSFILEMPDIAQKMEHSTNQFSTDMLTIKVCDIGTWDTNVFSTLTAGDYVEFRRKPSIGIGDSAMSTDSTSKFAGFIDCREGQLNYNNADDTITFTVYTAEDIGSRISVLNVNTQYINPDIDGAGTDGLILPEIKGVFVQDANVSSFVLKKGLHTLVYQYNAGTEQMKLDDGDFISLPGSDGTVDLVNGDGDQKVTLFVDVSQIPNSTELTDYIIVATAGDTLPRQPYFGVSIGFYLRKLYEQIGFTNSNVTNDTLQFATNDASAKYSYYDVPPQDISKTGAIYAMVNDGTYLYIGIGDTVYKRTMSNDSYSVLTTKSSYTVAKLWFNDRNGTLWIWYEGASTNYVRIYHFIGGTYDDVDVTSTSAFNAADVIDYNYSGGSWIYGLVYTDNGGNHDIHFVDNGGTDTQLYTAADLTGPGTGAGAQYDFLVVTGNTVYFQIEKDGDVNMTKIHVNASGLWENDHALYTMTFYIAGGGTKLTQFALHAAEGKLYGYLDGTSNVIKALTLSDGTIATVETLASGSSIDSMVYYNSQIYAAIVKYDVRAVITKTLYSLDAGAATLLASDAITSTSYRNLTVMGGVLYGVDIERRLWRYSATLQMYIKRSGTEDTDVKSMINQCLGAYNLLGKTSSHKKAAIYRRGNDAGAIQTSGNSITLNATNIVNAEKIQNAYPKIDWVEISNGTVTHSYDGTNFDTAVFSDVKSFKMTNPLLPDEVIKDVAKYFFAFWNISHQVYKIYTNIAAMQMEIFDDADATYSTGNLDISITSALILATTADQFGNVIFEVLA